MDNHFCQIDRNENCTKFNFVAVRSCEHFHCVAGLADTNFFACGRNEISCKRGLNSCNQYLNCKILLGRRGGGGALSQP